MNAYRWSLAAVMAGTPFSVWKMAVRGLWSVMSCNEHKPPPIEVYMEPFYPPQNGQRLLVNLCILPFSLGQRSGCKSYRPFAAIRHDM